MGSNLEGHWELVLLLSHHGRNLPNDVAVVKRQVLQVFFSMTRKPLPKYLPQFSVLRVRIGCHRRVARLNFGTRL
jgi:hypothetical protein